MSESLQYLRRGRQAAMDLMSKKASADSKPDIENNNTSKDTNDKDDTRRRSNTADNAESEVDNRENDDTLAPPKSPRRGRDNNTTNSQGNQPSNDIEMGIINRNQDSSVRNIEANGPLRVLEPFRTDPIQAQKVRQKRLERLAASSVPEIHYVGQIVSGQKLISDSSEGACCRWKVDYGKAWEHLGGEILGQTQTSYCSVIDSEEIPFNHPLDLHFAEAGLQGWGGPRIAFQSYRLDCYGRRILSGYGFAHLPTSQGLHRVEVQLWRPIGSPEQEMDAFMLGRTPALINDKPIYESAWKERCRLVTVPAGKVTLDLFVVTRLCQNQGIDSI